MSPKHHAMIASIKARYASKTDIRPLTINEIIFIPSTENRASPFEDARFPNVRKLPDNLNWNEIVITTSLDIRE